MQNAAITSNAEHRVLQPLLYTKRDVAALLSLSLRTIDNLITRKELPAIRVGGRVLIKATDVQQFIRTQPSAQNRRIM